MSASTKETAAAIRKELRATYPGTKFSVRMATGTAYGWLAISWVDGPAEHTVRALTAKYRSLRFDGSDDGYHQTGVTEWSCSGINTQRQVTQAFVDRALALVKTTTEGEPFIIGEDGTMFVDPIAWDADSVARRYCYATSEVSA